jgi:hypothetical protein
MGEKSITVTEEKSVIEIIAMAAHEMNRDYCKSLGDMSQPYWCDASASQKESVLDGVRFHVFGSGGYSPERSHENWMARKTHEGWSHGPVKDEQKKQHPCFLPYAELPEAQKMKDRIFVSVVHATYCMLMQMRPDLHEVKDREYAAYCTGTRGA